MVLWKKNANQVGCEITSDFCALYPVEGNIALNEIWQIHHSFTLIRHASVFHFKMICLMPLIGSAQISGDLCYCIVPAVILLMMSAFFRSS